MHGSGCTKVCLILQNLLEHVPWARPCARTYHPNMRNHTKSYFERHRQEQIKAISRDEGLKDYPQGLGDTVERKIHFWEAGNRAQCGKEKGTGKVPEKNDI